MRAMQPSLRMAPLGYPIALPHMTWSRGTLYFCGRPVRGASHEEWTHVLRCDGSRTLRQLATTLHDASAIAAAASWLIWWDSQLDAAAAAVPKKVTRLVLSTGPETAWLGMGGRLLMEAATHPSRVITCFGFTARTAESVSFLTPEDLAAITRDECSLAARLARVAEDLWELPAQELRNPTDPARGGNVEWLKSMLREVIEQNLAGAMPEEIFVPFAAESGSDAGVLLDVILSMFVDGLLGSAAIHIFESTPVAIGHRPVDEFLSRFEKSYIQLEEYFFPLAGRGLQKGALLEIFRSCIDNPIRDAWLASACRNSALGDCPDAGTSFAERFWRVV